MVKRVFDQQKSFVEEINKQFPLALKLLYFLLAIDLFFVLLHFYSLSLPLTESTKMLRLDMDFGYAETFQYIKFISLSVLLAVLFFKEKIMIYLSWCLFFLFLFADDAFALHENFGAQFARYFEISGFLGLRAQDIGELVIVAAVALLFLIPFLYTLLWGKEKPKRVTLHFILLMGVLVFFGVAMDMLHSFLGHLPGGGILTVIEDGGEMLAGSLLVWYTIYLLLEAKSTSKITTGGNEEKTKMRAV